MPRPTRFLSLITRLSRLRLRLRALRAWVSLPLPRQRIDLEPPLGRFTPHCILEITAGPPHHVAQSQCIRERRRAGRSAATMDTSYLAQQVTTIIGQLHGLFDEIGVPSHERDSREAEVRTCFRVARARRVRCS